MDKKEELAYYGKLLHDKALVIGAGGNISVREPEGFIIKRKFSDMSTGNKEDYISVNFEDLAETEKIVSSETPLHIGCYEAQSNNGAVMHVHSPYMVAIGEKVKVLKSPSYEFDCIVGQDIPILEYIQPGSKELAKEVKVLAQKGHTAILLKRHGGIAMGQDLHQAYLRIMALERACITALFV